jgi:uncharacterized protein (TIGR02271 family)
MMTITIGEPGAGRTTTGQTGTGAITTTDQASTGQGGTATTVQERIESDQADIALRKEELVVGKREVSNGSVLVRKVVRTENVSQPVELRREEYVVERIPASEAQNVDASARGAAFQGQEIFIPLRREEAVAGKRAVLVENVRIGKRVETERQTVTHPIRSENVEVVKSAGQADQVGAAPGTATTGTVTEDTTTAAPATTQSPADNTIRLAREELVVGKREVSNGGVLLRKVVQTQQASQPLDLRREEFVLDRSPVSDQQASTADFRAQEFRVDLFREEPVVNTRSVVTEVVRVRKKVETDSQNVTGVIRHENVEVVRNDTGAGARDREGAMNRMETGQGGTAFSSQSGSTTITDSSTMARERDLNQLRTGELRPTTRQPIPPPKGGEVLQYQDFDGVPTPHR